MPIDNSDCAATYKALIVGDSGVGKSAILNRLTGRNFDERWRPTVGVDFVTKIIEADGALIEMRIWDTAGLESFRSMTRRQFRGVQGVFLVYDITSQVSFDSLTYWLSAIPNSSHQPPSSFPHSYEPIPFVVLGNKADQGDKRNVSIVKGMKMANSSMAFGFYETSAKTGKNIFEAFHKMAFTITDINHPRLMKSYHRHQIRPMGTKDDVMRASFPVYPASSSSITMRQNSTSSPSSKVSASNPSTSSRRHTLSTLPFSILRTRTKAIKKNYSKRKSWSVALTTKSDIKNKDFSSKSRNETNNFRNSFGGWERSGMMSLTSKRDVDVTFSSKNRDSGNFISNIIMAEPSMTMEGEKGRNSTVKKKEKKKKK